jgi:chaperonin GroES
MELKTKLKLQDVIKSPNIAEDLCDEDLRYIGSKAVSDYNNDLSSRYGWETSMEDALKLAMQVTEDKTFPWPGASNVKFPLITIAALQYHARAYPALISGTSLVKCRTIGEDPQGLKVARAKRIEAHMSYQILEEDSDWEEEMDKTLLVQSIMGSAFKKTYFNAVKGYNESELVLPKDLVISYFTKSFEQSRRYTHVLQMTKNDLLERERRGLFLEGNDSVAPLAPSTGLDVVKDMSQGITQTFQGSDTPYTILEQHCWLDLDGDGYEEPYIVSVRLDTSEVKRIVARFYSDSVQYTTQAQIKVLEGQLAQAQQAKHDKMIADIGKEIEKLKENSLVVYIKAEEYFTKYTFIPSPDGGFYGMGWGLLLGPTNKSIDTLINQLIDAGTLSNTAGGFLGRGAKIRKGDNSFKPFEWKPVDSVGDDLRKNVFPLPVRDPSNVTLQLLQLLISYGEKIGMSVDILTGGNPGQNTPAETSRTMVEQGMKIFSGVYKRTYRSLKDEFRKLYRLNQLFLQSDADFENLTQGEGAKVLVEDYLGNPTDVKPAADPEVVSKHERQTQAANLATRALQVPGYDKYLTEVAFLESMNVPNISKIYPDPKGPAAIPPPPNIKMEEAKMKAQSAQSAHEIKLKLGMAKLMQQADLDRAKIHQMEADVILKLKTAGGIDTGHEIALLNAQIGAAKNHQDGIMQSVKLLHEIMQGDKGGNTEAGMGGVGQASSNSGDVSPAQGS